MSVADYEKALDAISIIAVMKTLEERSRKVLQVYTKALVIISRKVLPANFI